LRKSTAKKPQPPPTTTNITTTTTMSALKMQYLQRNKTTAVQAMEIEDRKDHPLRDGPHSARYFELLKARRALPVSNSRQDFLNTYHQQQVSKYHLLLFLSGTY
jgi:hypothetical protein